MNKMISFVLLSALLLMCFLGCSIPSDTNTEKESDPETSPNINDDINHSDQESEANTEKESGLETSPNTTDSTGNSDQENETYYAALNEFFAKMQKDTNGMEKIQFYIERQDLHYQLKESGEYYDERWIDATIIVTVDCNYDLATNEDWYKACSNTDFITLNTAFFNEYSHEFSEGHFTAWGVLPALHFGYTHSASTFSEIIDIFYSDYTVLKRLADLEYVNCIYIQYFYSVPGSIFDE